MLAEDHERGGAVVPALADVGAVRLLADGVEPELAHQPLEAVVVLGAGRAHLQPLGLGLTLRQLVGSLLSAADEIEGNGAQPFNFILAGMAALAITWFGHATFVLTTPGGKRIVFDPWLTGNPKTPGGGEDRQGRRDLPHARAFRSLRRRGGGGARDRRAGGRGLRAGQLVPGQRAEGRHRDGGRRHGRGRGAEDLDDAGGAHEQHRRRRQGPLRGSGDRASWSAWKTTARSTSPATRRSSATCG